MCTVTWRQRDGGYDLFCNRDERRTRRPALSPRRHEAAECSYLAPIDGDAGGTWVAVNDRGLGLTLLNDYASDAGPGSFESRGLLVARLARESSPAAALDRLEALDLERYRPFRLLLLAPGEPASVRHWNGRREAPEAVVAPALLTSSGFDPAAVDAARRQLLDRMATGSSAGDLHLDFHRSHEPERGPLSPCMHREDASTVSFTRVEVDSDRAVARMSYVAGPPCRGSARTTERLELALRRLPATAGA